jgi:hypothetical protein
MSIFKDGMLNPEYINPNYRGNWPMSVPGFCELLIVKDDVFYYWSDERQDVLSTRCKDVIYKFTPEDIQEGELCWMWYLDTDWVLRVFDNVKIGVDNKYRDSEGNRFKYCVPFLIAETAEKAEELKHWSNNG